MQVPKYGKEWVRPDLIAGLTAASVVTAAAMPHATIAGLPVQVGLSTAFLYLKSLVLPGDCARLCARMTTLSTRKGLVLCAERFLLLTAATLVYVSAARSEQLPTQTAVDRSQQAVTSARAPQNRQDDRQTGSISGKVVDPSGANIVGAVVKLTRDSESSGPETTSDEDGLFAFTHVTPGPFRLTISFPGLTSQEFSGTLESGQAFVTPINILSIPTQVAEVHVELTHEELAQAQIEEQEKQRVFGVLPNFYVTYIPNPVSLSAKQKFELAWKSATDPITIVGIGAMAGFDQAGDRWGAYGQGAQGYAKRFGATYVNVFGATFVGGAIMPSILKQDPRYFYKGTGTKRSRILRALSSSIMCKGDNGRWQPNYSNIVGSFAGAGLGALYLPANDRRGTRFVVSSALIRLGETSLAGVLQEFVLPRFTPNHPTRSHR